MGVTSPQFVHLHNHTEYSRQDGLSRVGEMFEVAAADGQVAIASTDHGTLANVPSMLKAAEATGLKPIFGLEAYLAIGSRKEKNSLIDTDDGTEPDEGSQGRKTRRYHHLTLLAATAVGWRNLVGINNDAANHVWHKPRTDMDMLTQRNEGLLIGTGCLGGPVASRLLTGDREGAAQSVEGLLAVVGGDKERLFVEVMSHGIDVEDRIVTPGLIELAKYFGLRLVATNDAHYCHAQDAPAHDLLLALGTNARLSDPGRYRFSGKLVDGIATGYHLKTAAEMHQTFAGIAGAQDAVRNSLAVAEMVQADVMPSQRVHLPKFPVPQEAVDAWGARKGTGDTRFATAADHYLHQRMAVGAQARYGTPLPEQVKSDLAWEHQVISGAGMSDYMLIEEDCMAWARTEGIVTGPGRGSAVGSRAAYALGVTDVEPGEHGLLFERFLDPSRVGMPDVDSDFDRAGRPRVLRHLQDTYGHDRVALIGTRGTYKAKGLLRHVGRLTAQSEVGAALAETVYSRAGQDATLAELLDENNIDGAPFRDVLASDPAAKAILALAKPLEGARSGLGIHACGVLISDEPIEDTVPVRLDKASGMWVTEWEGPELDALGYLKLDRLGLRTLDVVSTALSMIEASTGERPDISYRGIEIDPDVHPRAERAWSMLGAGATEGVFQLAGEGMRKLARQVQPRDLSDLSALVALYRPGPMAEGMHESYGARKHGQEPVTYDYLTSDPVEQAVIASVLGDTYGLVVYQEQTMALAGVVAGFGPPAKNRLRKAFSKKKKEEMDALRQAFIDGAQQTTVDGPDSSASQPFARATAVTLWRTFEASASYLFNASHSVAYGFLGYITAYLKANWPSQFGAATLATTSDEEKRVAILESLRTEGVQVRGPSVLAGRSKTWVADDGSVVLGLSEVDGVGEHASAIVAEREAGGPFTSLADLVNRVKVTSATQAQDKAEYSSRSRDVCHQCLGVIEPPDDEPCDDDISAFGVCGCIRPRVVPEPDDGPRTETAPGGGTVTVAVVQAGKQFRLRRTDREPVRDAGGQPVMATANLSLGIVESLINAGACDDFGPRLGMTMVVRALRDCPDLRVPDVQVGIIELARTERTKLGVSVGKGSLGEPDMIAALGRWDLPDGERSADLVGVHRVPTKGYTLCVGTVTSWSERRTRAGKQMANFTLSGTKSSIKGVMWASGLDELHDAGTVVAAGDVAAVRGQVRTRTITRQAPTAEVTLDTETGDEVETVLEQVQVRELSADRLWVYPGDVGARSHYGPGPALARPRIGGSVPAGPRLLADHESDTQVPQTASVPGSADPVREVLWEVDLETEREPEWSLAAAMGESQVAGLNTPAARLLLYVQGLPGGLAKPQVAERVEVVHGRQVRFKVVHTP